MKYYILLLLLLFSSYEVCGIPASPFPFVVNQPDGSKMKLTIVGDENFHYYKTEDGVPLLQMCENEENAYYYAIVKDNAMIPSDVLGHSKNNRSRDEEKFIQSHSGNVSEFIESRRSINHRNYSNAATRKEGISVVPNSYIGGKRGLVILINFADIVMEKTQNEIDRQFNEVGYHENNHIGSVHDYFHDQSYGNFDLTFDVIGPVTVNRELSYYGANDYATGRTDIRIGRLITEACKLADEYVDYSVYDWNCDGNVDQVFFIYAGYGEASGGQAYTIWPHQYNLTSCKYFGDGDGPLLLDGVTVDSYACSCELAGSIGNSLNGIGTACHEFSHCLGLPDVYDVDYNGGFGMGYLDIMSAGSYSGPEGRGEVPYGYSAYERWLAGWLDYREIDRPLHVGAMKNIAEEPISYIMYNSGNHNEYLIIENHSDDRWFSYAGTGRSGHGLLITHVDYDSRFWEHNIINTRPDHQRMSYIPAGGFLEENKFGALSDFFPGITNQTYLDNVSHSECGGKFFNLNIKGNYSLDRFLRNITESDSNTISFDVVFMDMDAPIAETPLYNDSIGFGACWSDVEGSDSYIVNYTTVHSVKPFSATSETVNVGNATTLEIEWKSTSLFSTYKVKALGNGSESDWSNQVRVNYPTSTSVNVLNDNNSGPHSPYYDMLGHKITFLGKGVFIKDGKKYLKK